MSTDEAKILKQVEFYFSDSNLPHDKFLLKQISLDDGWIPIATLASFSRMRQFDAKTIPDALRKSESLLEVNEEGTKVRRKSSYEDQYDESKWIYAKGYPLDATLDPVKEYWDTQGNCLCVRFRRRKDKVFKGSVFIEFSTSEEAKGVASKEHKFDDEVLKVMTKTEYIAMKNNERADRGTKRKSPSSADTEADNKDQEPPTYTKDRLLKIDGLPDTSAREDIKDILESHCQVQWIDFGRGRTEGIIQLKDDEKGATALAAKLTEDKVEIAGVVPTYGAIEGDEELQYYVEVQRKKNSKTGKRRKHRR